MALISSEAEVVSWFPAFAPQNRSLPPPHTAAGLPPGGGRAGPGRVGTAAGGHAQCLHRILKPFSGVQ